MENGILNGLEIKRKRSTDDSTTKLSEEIKKFRITVKSPGELRFQKELKSYDDDNSLKFYHSDTHTVLEFLNLPYGCPHLFSIMIPKYYPHYPPQIKCLYVPMSNSYNYIEPNGDVTHPDITDNWTALDSFEKIVQTLYSLALSYNLVDSSKELVPMDHS